MVLWLARLAKMQSHFKPGGETRKPPSCPQLLCCAPSCPFLPSLAPHSALAWSTPIPHHLLPYPWPATALPVAHSHTSPAPPTPSLPTAHIPPFRASPSSPSLRLYAIASLPTRDPPPAGTESSWLKCSDRWRMAGSRPSSAGRLSRLLE